VEGVFSEGNFLCWTFLGGMEFENGLKEGSNSEGFACCCNLEPWKL